jgi:uncharacterized OB-fold protein
VSERAAPTRPAPVVTEDSEGFWSAAAEGRLVVQRCSSCHRYLHPPRPMCPHCHATGHEWVEAAGTGTVYSYALLHHPQHPSFDYPIIAALVELDEGVRIVTNLVDIDPVDVAIDLPVEVTFVPTLGGAAVPVFRPRDAR